MRITREFIASLPLRHVWLFITDRCNLACDYCFFQDKKGVQTISWPDIRWLLESLPAGGRHDIVISGGEPLLEWALVRRIIEFVRRELPSSGLTLQTNALLLNESRVLFLKARGVVVEPGVDGLPAANGRHRCGMTACRWKLLWKNIDLLLAHQVRMNPTMTVHPSQAEHMRRNFLWLAGRGLRNIDVHPAFMAPWHKEQVAVFDKGYRAIAACALSSGCGRQTAPLVCRDYHQQMPMAFDLLVQPDGRVLPNWTYLTFPRKFREAFCLMTLARQGGRVHAAAMGAYLQDLQGFFRRQRTYREFSNFNAARILKAVGTQAQKQNFDVYRAITRRQQEIDAR